MSVLFFCPRWGAEEIPWEEFCKKVRLAGFDGIEYAIGRMTSLQELDLAWNCATKYGLLIIAQHFDTIEANFAAHLECFEKWFERLWPYPVVKINSQTGKDHFSFEQNARLIEAVHATGKEVVHETHRSKFSFAAHITREFLIRLSHLRITFDVSHWVCVAESFLDDQEEAIELAIERADHIHARVGYPEGPQVPDPRISEWQPALMKHLVWWDRIAGRQQKNQTTLTITPEFGPYPYMTRVPTSQLPISDQWELNVFMLELLKSRYT